MSSKDELNAWITARHAEGMWVTPCAAMCGVWFAQERKGRRSILCEKHRCRLFHVYRRINNQAPRPALIAKWKVEYGDMPRKSGGKVRPEMHCEAAA